MIAVGQGLMGYIVSEPDLLFAQQLSKDQRFAILFIPVQSSRFSKVNLLY